MTRSVGFSEVFMAVMSVGSDGDVSFPVATTVDELKTQLALALGVEHLTIPPYLTAMYTIKPGTNTQAMTVIRSVVMEEMLHMTLVANLLNALGGQPSVARSQFVSHYPARFPFDGFPITVPLQHFSKEALQTFCKIEHPKSLPNENSPAPTVKSIGAFYGAIRTGLENLVHAHGERAVFVGTADRQIGPENFYNSGGEVFAIHDLSSAHRALQTIIEQGEGRERSVFDTDDELFGETRQPAHYYRFDELLRGRAYQPKNRPGDLPSGDIINVSWDDVYPISPQASIADYKKHRDKSVFHHAVAFNETYGELLHHLDRAFDGKPDAMRDAVPVMNELRDLASALVHNPHPNPRLADHGVFASPTFEITSQELIRGRERARTRLAFRST